MLGAAGGSDAVAEHKPAAVSVKKRTTFKPMVLGGSGGGSSGGGSFTSAAGNVGGLPLALGRARHAAGSRSGLLRSAAAGPTGAPAAPDAAAELRLRAASPNGRD
jgi:hypothetical protein